MKASSIYAIKRKRDYDFGYEVPPKSREELTLDANHIQRTIGYKGDDPFPIVKFVERILPECVDGYEFYVATKDELGPKLGETFPDQHLIKLREDIYDAAVNGDPMSLMTCAHEVGHLFEHENLPLAFARKEATAATPAYKSSEWQASAFGGELLMPSSKIVHMESWKICLIYGVSQAAARTQRKAIVERRGQWTLPTL